MSNASILKYCNLKKKFNPVFLVLSARGVSPYIQTGVRKTGVVGGMTHIIM